MREGISTNWGGVLAESVRERVSFPRRHSHGHSHHIGGAVGDRRANADGPGGSRSLRWAGEGGLCGIDGGWGVALRQELDNCVMEICWPNIVSDQRADLQESVQHTMNSKKVCQCR